jgi:hypothetical protein
MEFLVHSHRHGLEVIGQDERYRALWEEVTASIEAIHDDMLIERFGKMTRKSKSLSECINGMLKENLVTRGWSSESPIFQEAEFSDKRWRLDFAKDAMSIEVGFNHGEAISWNLLKPVLASELNHVKKAIDTKIGVVICATLDLKTRGGFDGAVGEYEKYIRYLRPMNGFLTVPMVLVGLLPPRSFWLDHQVSDRGKKYGVIKRSS